MNQSNSGAVASDNGIQSRLDKLENILSSYEQEHGLGSVKLPTEVDNYLNLTVNDMTKLTAEECGYGAYILTRFAHYLQKESNRQTSIATWVDKSIPIVIADVVQQYKGLSYEERKMQAIKHTEVAEKMYRIGIYAQQRRDRMEYQSMSVNNTANKLDSLQQTKRRDRH